jgi:hypothetical protein
MCIDVSEDFCASLFRAEGSMALRNLRKYQAAQRHIQKTTIFKFGKFCIHSVSFQSENVKIKKHVMGGTLRRPSVIIRNAFFYFLGLKGLERKNMAVAGTNTALLRKMQLF